MAARKKDTGTSDGGDQTLQAPPAEGGQDTQTPSGDGGATTQTSSTNGDQTPQTPSAPPAEVSTNPPDTPKEETKSVYLVNHTTKHSVYRRAGLVITRTPQREALTATQVAKLEADPWVVITPEKAT